jgi:acyl-CoA oxidase
MLALSVDDVLNVTPKFWSMHLDLVFLLDFGTAVIIGGHVNLTIGTIARYLPERPDLCPLMHSMLEMETIGMYLLSERGHSLDSINCKTTAIRFKDGFILHTLREEAMKCVNYLNTHSCF